MRREKANRSASFLSSWVSWLSFWSFYNAVTETSFLELAKENKLSEPIPTLQDLVRTILVWCGHEDLNLNASVYTNAKTIHSTLVEQMVFLLVKALPQALMNAALRVAAARFWGSLK